MPPKVKDGNVIRGGGVEDARPDVARVLGVGAVVRVGEVPALGGHGCRRRAGRRGGHAEEEGRSPHGGSCHPGGNVEIEYRTRGVGV